MVTRRHNTVSYYLLHFFGFTNDNDVYESVISRSPSTIRYYASRVEVTRNLFLVDFYELLVFEQQLWLTKYYVVPKETEANRFKEYYVPCYDARWTFDEFLGITNQTPNPTRVH
jgi:hypothetical protein